MRLFGPGARRLRMMPLGRRWARAVALVAALSTLLSLLGGAGWLYLRHFETTITRVDAFSPIPAEERPAKATGKALHILVAGTDQAGPSGGSQRTDTIILVRVSADGDRVHMVSIPRDTWTAVPTRVDSDDTRLAKINAAYAWGGTPLLVRTVEGFTGVRIDHAAVVDFAGFGRVIDSLGGVDVEVDKPYLSYAAGGITVPPGTRRMNSAMALEYARERHQFAAGDFTRIQHQQAIIMAILQAATRKGLLADPARLDGFLDAVSGAVRVDAGLRVTDLVWRLRGVTADRIVMLTSPSAGVDMIGDQSVVLPDRPRAASLYRALREGAVEQWLAENPH
ncbi:LCP family protein [Micromonospora marina]|uniref:Transcriptional attenuator, LytR family n=2 Tax=Micromonospora marina TaxID=307120 RepID=A0A1C4ZD17_9ACTN|nr:LCP family protein [Micromonospora marina]SCF30828.1 transcriptional attenuator, LytR family [Micromonospora marina]